MMAKQPYADIPRHKRFDADLRDLASLSLKVSNEAVKKASNAKSSNEREFFESLAEELRQHQQVALGLRHKLWEETT